MPRLFSATLITLVLAFSFSAEGAPFKYVGNKACNDECHKEIYDSWKESRHAKVFDLLKPGVRPKEKKEAGLETETDYTKDKSCMRCHVMGWQEGGYSFENKDENFKGVGCEDCHGPAERWLELHTNEKLKHRDRKLRQAGMKEPFRGRTVCRQCHYDVNNPYKYRDPDRLRDFTDPKMAETYHILK